MRDMEILHIYATLCMEIQWILPSTLNVSSLTQVKRLKLSSQKAVSEPKLSVISNGELFLSV
jgi:hypothetical protein